MKPSCPLLLALWLGISGPWMSAAPTGPDAGGPQATRGTKAATNPRLLLPAQLYAVEGLPLRLFYDHLVLQEQVGTYTLRFEHAPGGQAGKQSWVWQQPRAGNSQLQVSVLGSEGQVLAKATCTIHTAPKSSGRERVLRTLIVGDSLTHASAHPNHLFKLCQPKGNPALYLIGSHQPASALPEVRHEGYGGWRWQDFLERYDPKGDSVAAGPVARRATSPFVFAKPEGKGGQLDLQRYFDQHAAGQPPDLVIFMLGINDCFGAKPDAPEPIINACLDQADRLLAAMAKAAPKATLAVVLTPPPNARQSGFTANYQDRYTRWGWRRIQHRLVERMIERLGPRQGPQLRLWPAGLGLDPVAGYPDNNGVHPNTKGYEQLAEGIYAGMKCWLHHAAP